MSIYTIKIFPTRVWEPTPNGWVSRSAELEDHKRRREWLEQYYPTRIEPDDETPGPV